MLLPFPIRQVGAIDDEPMMTSLFVGTTAVAAITPLSSKVVDGLLVGLRQGMIHPDSHVRMAKDCSYHIRSVKMLKDQPDFAIYEVDSIRCEYYSASGNDDGHVPGQHRVREVLLMSMTSIAASPLP